MKVEIDVPELDAVRALEKRIVELERVAQIQGRLILALIEQSQDPDVAEMSVRDFLVTRSISSSLRDLNDLTEVTITRP